MDGTIQESEFASFVERLAEAIGAGFFEEDQAIGLDLPLDEGRRQRVYVGLATDAVENKLLVMYTRVGQADDVDPAGALELNATIAYGSLAILGGDLVLRRTERLTVVDAESLSEIVRLLALNADVIEESLYGPRDQY